MTDLAGNMVNQYAYDAFGEVTIQFETISNPFKFVGAYEVMDEGNGLLATEARHYYPVAGRFVSKDPIGFLSGETNLYGTWRTIQ